MHEADHVIEIPAGHRIAEYGISRTYAAASLMLCEPSRNTSIGARTHDLGDDGLGRVEHVVEDRALVFAQRRVRC